MMMNGPNSPLFPSSQLTTSITSNLGQDEISSLIPQLPDKPIAQTSSIQVYIITPEKHLFIQGFDANEYAERPPTLLRGCLFLRVLKPSKIKSISLTFKGQQRTEWPEGIPPKKTTYSEINDLISHTWPFYQPDSTAPNGGADLYQEPSRPNYQDADVSHLSLSENVSGAVSPVPMDGRGFLARSMSPAASFVKRATSPSALDSSSDLTFVSTAPDADASKPGHFPVGDYIYNFEHPLHPSVPESTSVNFGDVSYHLEFSIVRAGAFKPNITGKLPIEVVRIPSESSLQENEPIVISRDWEDQLRYEIVISGKSITLDSYLPLAFRFIPLFGKVSLHRIRVYLSEDLEYFCQNKRVHRMEPTKKYLLLDHKAQSGKSLLSINPEEDSEDDEVLPKELEFQLYVPSVLNGKHSYVLHPDTSFTNIQSHHWIKICLRISKRDPENPEKRKHYEISIDSPIHVLSPLASHSNTLLPAYDGYKTDMHNFSEMYVSTPPLSPDVIPVNLGGRMPNIDDFGATLNSMSLDDVLVSDNAQPETHQAATRKGSYPQADMHLEANLYKPEESSMKSTLNSPQAIPHPATFSPQINSPMQRPIHLLRRPSFNPPPFEESDDNMLSPSVLPPAYEEEDPKSMSPLRINNSSSSERRRVPSEVPSETPIIAASSEPVSIKAMLSQQLKTDNTHSDGKHDEANNDKYLSRPMNIPGTRSDQEEEDITNFSSSPIKPNEDFGINKAANLSLDRSNHSRKSSISSGYQSDSPIEQTLPLLTTSMSSLPTGHEEEQSRNASITSFVPENFRNYGQIDALRTEIVDIVDDDPSKGSAIGGNLSSLRNPRIKKHYQEVNTFGSVSDDSPVKKERQKSFGVVDDNTDRLRKIRFSSGTDKANELTVGDSEFHSRGSGTSGEASDESPPNENVPGFRYSYIID